MIYEELLEPVGLRVLVELSHNKSPESRVTFTIESEDKLFMAWTEEQVCCRDNICEKSKPGTAKS